MNELEKSIRNYDMLGIGSPVYIYRLPFIVIEYITSLPKLNGLPFFIFIMYGTKLGTMGTQLSFLFILQDKMS